jgi:hypothetical protein
MQQAQGRFGPGECRWPSASLAQRSRRTAAAPRSNAPRRGGAAATPSRMRTHASRPAISARAAIPLGTGQSVSMPPRELCAHGEVKGPRRGRSVKIGGRNEAMSRRVVKSVRFPGDGNVGFQRGRTLGPRVERGGHGSQFLLRGREPGTRAICGLSREIRLGDTI